MKILLWNIRTGGSGRTEALADAVTAQDADVVVLNEYRTGGTDRLLSLLAERGWHHAVCSDAPSPHLGVAVVSRVPLMSRTVAVEGSELARRCVVVEVPGSGVDLWAVYAPYAGPEVDTFWGAVLEQLRQAQGRDALVIGDFNAGMPASDVPESARLAGNRFVEDLSSAGFVDLWRRTNGPDAREHSWQGSVNGYRIDHAFGSPGISSRVRACHYRHDERLAQLSDHSMLCVEISPKALATKGSQRWLQVAVNHRPSVLDEPILQSIEAPAGATLEWLSPLEREGYIEYRDGATYDRLGVNIPQDVRQAFWPAGGPVWDGLARVAGANDLIIVEAKAHIQEMLSGGTRATGAAREQIASAIADVKREIAPHASADWSGRFYQYVNRLAHLRFLRAHGASAHLVYVCFTDAPDVRRPATREQWEGALELVNGYLGVGRTGLGKYVHHVFVDARELAGFEIGTARPSTATL